MLPLYPRTWTALLGFVSIPALLAAQAAVDPSVAPRAAQLARAGDPARATEMLGRYLATAPDDGSAWLELGQLYLADSRSWHREGHDGDPEASLLLDFAATALDQSLRLPTDSSALIRALIEIERAAGAVEETGWGAVRASFVMTRGSGPPRFVSEIGRNLVNSCPVGGVLVTGSDLEAVAAWSAVLGAHSRGDLVLVIASRFSEDSIYRGRMAQVLEGSPSQTMRATLTAASARRPICISPATDTAIVPSGAVTVVRLVRVIGPAAPEVPDPLSVRDLLEAEQAHPDAVTEEVLSLYRNAARYNPLLCASLLAPFGARARDGCGR